MLIPGCGWLGGGPQAFPGGPQDSLRLLVSLCVWGRVWQLMEVMGHTHLSGLLSYLLLPWPRSCLEGPVSTLIPAGP